MADAYDKAGYLDIAETHLKELLCLELSKEQKLEALCFLADIQVPTSLTPIHDAWLLWGYHDSAGSISTRRRGGLMRNTQCLLIPSADEDREDGSGEQGAKGDGGTGAEVRPDHPHHLRCCLTTFHTQSCLDPILCCSDGLDSYGTKA